MEQPINPEVNEFPWLILVLALIGIVAVVYEVYKAAKNNTPDNGEEDFYDEY